MAATGSSAASNTSEATSDALRRKSGDVGWEYGELISPTDLSKIRCKLCGKVINSGINRLKQHIAGIKGSVTSCPKSTELDKQRCRTALAEPKTKKKEKKEHLKEVREEVHINEEDDEIIEIGSKRPRELGPMDQYASKINPEATMNLGQKTRQKSINDALFTSRSNDVHAYLARWVYESGIPFHATVLDSFHRFVEAVGQFGPGYVPPSQYQLREPLLKQEVERTKKSLKEQEEEWWKTGCSIMTDAWTDRKRRSIMNLCVNCRLGTSFLSSVEDSEEAHTGQYIFEYVDKCIEDLGPQNVVQVVTDNASNNMAAAMILKEKRPNIFWTSCATHTLNLILEGIGKTPRFKGVIEKAKALTIFIYAHHKTLAMMRKFTKKRDIVRPGVTRFASSYLTLQSLMEKKDKLRLMFSSEEWGECKWSKSTKGKAAMGTILSLSFWNGVSMALRVFGPLVKVLRLVDGDWKPSMGFLVGELEDAKKEVMGAFKNNENTYKPILEIIDAKAKDRLDSPLHLAGYFLNPYYYFRDDKVEKDPRVMDAMITCIENFFPDDFDTQHILSNVELLKYKQASAGWWSNYGVEIPNLQRMVMRILSLTSSSSGCERNWSTFEGIHTKKRNRLDASRLNNLVYVQFNAKLFNEKKRMKERGGDVLLANEASKAQGWIVDGGDEEEEDEVYPGSGLTWRVVGEAAGADDALEPRRSRRVGGSSSSSSRTILRNVRELDEDNFQLDDETEDEGVDEEIVFEESDEDRVLVLEEDDNDL
ncbi:uncharacterized protein LOC143875954 [Tasmannia lanceolata]|uniref:uncharacterized protein LOC143875954 n=1 Tax=Tasmannia lanceolata TaxID=3420 RepID=UPI0040627D45